MDEQFRRMYGQQTDRSGLQERARWIAVDFDGVLAPESRYPDTGSAVSWELVERLRELCAEGYKFIIHSCRLSEIDYEGTRTEGILKMLSFLREHSIPHHDIWTQRGKPVAALYIDDRSLSPEDVTDMTTDELLQWMKDRGDFKREGDRVNASTGGGQE